MLFLYILLLFNPLPEHINHVLPAVGVTSRWAGISVNDKLHVCPSVSFISVLFYEKHPLFIQIQSTLTLPSGKAVGHEFSLSADREGLLLLLRKHTEPVLLWPVLLALVLSHSVQHK